MPFCEPDIATSTPPGIHLEGHAAERGHGVDHQQRVVPGRAHRLADRRDVVHDARGGVDLRHQHGLDGAPLVGLEARLDFGRPHGAAHVALQHLDLDTHATGILAPADGEAAALEHQDLVALGQHVGEGGLPGAVAVGDIDVGAALGVEHAGDVAQQAVGQRQQGARIDVHRRTMHRPQHLVGHCRRTRNRQELTPRTHAHLLPPFASAAAPAGLEWTAADACIAETSISAISMSDRSRLMCHCAALRT